MLVGDCCDLKSRISKLAGGKDVDQIEVEGVLEELKDQCDKFSELCSLVQRRIDVKDSKPAKRVRGNLSV